MVFSRKLFRQMQSVSTIVRHEARRSRTRNRIWLAAWMLTSSRRSLAVIAEGKGRPTISNVGDISKTKPTGAADALEQFADRLLNLQSPAKRTHDRTPVVTSPSLERATLRNLALTIFEAYPSIPWYHPEKQGWEKTRLIQFLAEECAPTHSKVRDAAETFLKRFQQNSEEDSLAAGGDLAMTIQPSIHHLYQACLPEYESVITNLLQIQADKGLAFLLLLRRDLLNWIAYQYDQPKSDSTTMKKYKQLDQYLCRLFQTWFAPGLLRVERITYETTSAAVIERIARNEAVHPVQDLQDLRRRLGPDRRVFCLFHPLLDKTRPLLALYVALTDNVPGCMDTIHNQPSKNLAPRVATFYSISNFETGLKGVGLGEYLIHQAVEALQNELPCLQTFCTLSPMPTFRSWLRERSATSTGKFASQDLLDAATTAKLADEFQVSPGQAISAMVGYLQDHHVDTQAWDVTNDPKEETRKSVVRDALLKLAAYYLIHEKHRRQPLDPVARFHVGNGALVHAIRWRADTSRKGWNNSFGVMVNYEYDLTRLTENQAQYERSFTIPMADSVKALVE